MCYNIVVNIPYTIATIFGSLSNIIGIRYYNEITHIGNYINIVFAFPPTIILIKIT